MGMGMGMGGGNMITMSHNGPMGSMGRPQVGVVCIVLCMYALEV